MKDAIRKQLITLRQQLQKSQVQQLSLDLCHRLMNHDVFLNNQTIAMYHPFDNEVSLLPLFNSTRRLALPVIVGHNRMQFRQYNPNTDELINNGYSIAEPIHGALIKHKDLDLCLMPLAGFDRKGNRLGMGGGYYDRYFELNKFQKKPTVLAGVAYDFQESDTIASEIWDIPLDIIFTNKETIEL